MRISDWSSDVCSSDLVGALEAVFENEELAALMERCAGLGQRARRVARLDDDRAFGEGAHRDIALREEEPVMLGRLLGVAKDGHLRSEERRVGKEWDRTCRSRWSPEP